MTQKPNKGIAVDVNRVVYLHVVAYYYGDVAGPVTFSWDIGARIEHSVGSAPTDFSVFARADTPPGKEWEGGKSASLWSYGTLLPSGLTQIPSPAKGLDESLVWSVGMNRQRPRAAMKMVDYDWNIECEQAVSHPHVQLDAHVLITIRLELFPYVMWQPKDPIAHAAVRNLTNDLVGMAIAAGNCYYLLVDVATLRETGGHCLYIRDGSPVYRGDSLARFVERTLWFDLREARRERVRGVFWGNYLNPSHLERLGGKKQFAERYIEYAKTQVLNTAELVTETEGGGLFVRISREPRHQDANVNAPHLGVMNAAWLHREFRRAGLLM